VEDAEAAAERRGKLSLRSISVSLRAVASDLIWALFSRAERRTFHNNVSAPTATKANASAKEKEPARNVDRMQLRSGYVFVPSLALHSEEAGARFHLVYCG
jgi:hypothetical protein